VIQETAGGYSLACSRTDPAPVAGNVPWSPDRVL